MKHVGHTMATPDRTVEQAINLFADSGCQATELIAMTPDEQGDKHGPAVGDAPIPSYEWSDAASRDLAARATDRGVPVLTITQYIKTFNSNEPAWRTKVLDQMGRYIHWAGLLGASYVRVHGGADSFGPSSWDRAAQSLRMLCDVAEQARVTLLLENHPGTLTVTGEASARMVRQVDHPRLRILYDPANVLAHSDEPVETTWQSQQDLITYVHVKDYCRQDGHRMACPVGRGEVPWERIIGWLRSVSYTGPLSYEYERKWNREQLPPPEEGLPESVNYVKRLLHQDV